MKSAYVKTVAMAALATFGILPVVGQAQLIDLGATTGYALNNSGQAALASGIYSNGAVTPLPALPGWTTPATPIAINASGQAVGSALVGPAGSSTSCNVPIEYSGGTLIDIPLGNPCGGADPYVGSATGINSTGTVIGVYQAAIESHGETTTFTYSNGALTIIDVPCALSVAGVFSTNLCAPDANVFGNEPYSINDSGEVVGTITLVNNSDYGPCAYLASNGVWTCLGHGTAYAINASGEVTGSLQVFRFGEPPGTGSADGGQVIGTYTFLYGEGTTSNLGTLPGGTNSTGYAINATGQIVGSSDFAGSGKTTHAFFYNGVMTDLNSLVSSTDPLQPFVTLTSGVAVNDSRVILANGVDSRTGKGHAYLLQAPWINVGPTVLAFGAAAVGATSPNQSVTVGNAGTSTITLGTIAASTGFSIKSNSCSTSLAPSGTCTVAAAYAPTKVGASTGTLTVSSAGVSYSVALTGSGTIVESIAASAKAAFVGQSITLTWTASAGATCSTTSSSTNPAWTASKPTFDTLNAPASGTQTLTETVSGTVTYTLACNASGMATQQVSTSVVWTLAPLTVSISASPTTITAGQSTTLSWKSSNATSCTATGGGADDNWSGTKSTSGSQTITEAVALDTSSVVLTYGITCNSTTSGLSDKASVNVTEKQAPASSSGGGALNPVSLAFLAGILALRRVRIRIARP
jgi:probable HAF family extracellular repeat protein